MHQNTLHFISTQKLKHFGGKSCADPGKGDTSSPLGAFLFTSRFWLRHWDSRPLFGRCKRAILVCQFFEFILYVYKTELTFEQNRFNASDSAYFCTFLRNVVCLSLSVSLSSVVFHIRTSCSICSMDLQCKCHLQGRNTYRPNVTFKTCRRPK